MNEHRTATVADVISDELPGTRLFEEQRLYAPAPHADPVSRTAVQAGIALLRRQATDGYWRFDLEADTTIPSEYILYHRFLGDADQGREQRLAAYIRQRQLADGSWPLYEGGPGNISATVKAYFALKVTGEDPASGLMKQARRWVLTHGGAESANVFTRILLATFGQIPWRTVPAMPVEIIWLPRWFFFNLGKVSYWSRCVIVPLLIIFTKRPIHRLSPDHQISELFLTPPQTLRHIDGFRSGNLQKNCFIAIDRLLKLAEPFVPAWVRRQSLRECERWVRRHMSGDGGIGAIYPAMANAVMALKLLGNDGNDADMARGMRAIENLVVEDEQQTRTLVQPCVSPIWDTCLSISALSENGLPEDNNALQPAIDWLFDKQVFVPGDWSAKVPHLEGGGWAFQFENAFYPDVDDTSMVVMALLRAGAHQHAEKRERIAQAVNWTIGMQNADGGWGAFDVDNGHEYLNNIPFADHGALVDPSTADLTARVIEMLAMLGYDRSFQPIARGLEFLRDDQKEYGAWFGRWGVNYIYGTWAVLVALGALGENPNQPYIRKAVTWLKSIQNDDGGWGESCDSYDDPGLHGSGESTASQTAWALLGLMAVAETGSEAVARGIHYLVRNYEGDRGWREATYTGTGFPRVFYLLYHGYSHYFPLWALGVYRAMEAGKKTRQEQIRDSGPIDLGPLPVLERRRLG